MQHCMTLRWCHNGHDSVSNHQPHTCFLNRLFRLRSKKTSKLHVTGLCVGNSLEASEFPAQMASNAESVSIWWRHYGLRQNRYLRLNSQQTPHTIPMSGVSIMRIWEKIDHDIITALQCMMFWKCYTKFANIIRVMPKSKQKCLLPNILQYLYWPPHSKLD